MSTLVVVGAQWGDEGKGKVTDVIAEQAQLVARFAGGNNAGHTLVVDGKKIVTHLVPSGCTYPGTICLLGAGMVIDPEVFQDEVATLQGQGLLQGDELRVSLDAHLILPYHRDLDGAREDFSATKGQAIGTTRRGIGPCYEAKAARRGIKVRDLFDRDLLRERLERNAALANPEFERLGSDARVDLDAIMKSAREWADWMRPMVCDAGAMVIDALERDEKVLFEGAQGAMLDVDHGTYPYVTSSATTAGGVCTGLGVGPTVIKEVWGITKAYTTRVGAGPFPTKIEGEEAERLRQAGGEFGATTGRPRDCGWLDLPALRYAARLNGMTGLCVTKLDVLAMLPEIKICRSYRDGVTPGTDAFEKAVPEYETLPGWKDEAWASRLSEIRRYDDLPGPVRAYLDLIAADVGVSISLVSIGPGRDQTIMLRAPFG